MHWPTEILACAAGILRQHHAGVSTYEILSAVWTVASREDPTIGGLRLMHRVRVDLLSRAAAARPFGLPASRFLIHENALPAGTSDADQIGKE